MISSGTPTSYDQFIREYTPYVRGAVVQQGIDPNDAEDVANDILLAFFEQDRLALYDPERLTMTGEKVTFKTYVNVHIRTQIRRRLDKQFKRSNHETSYDADDFTPGADVLSERAFEDIALSTDFSALRKHLSSIRPAPNAEFTLADVLDAVLDTFASNERNSVLPNFPELGDRVRLSRSGARRWYRILEAEVRNWYSVVL